MPGPMAIYAPKGALKKGANGTKASKNRSGRNVEEDDVVGTSGAVQAAMDAVQAGGVTKGKSRKLTKQAQSESALLDIDEDKSPKQKRKAKATEDIKQNGVAEKSTTTTAAKSPDEKSRRGRSKKAAPLDSEPQLAAVPVTPEKREVAAKNIQKKKSPKKRAKSPAVAVVPAEDDASKTKRGRKPVEDGAQTKTDVETAANGTSANVIVLTGLPAKVTLAHLKSFDPFIVHATHTGTTGTISFDTAEHAKNAKKRLKVLFGSPASAMKDIQFE